MNRPLVVLGVLILVGCVIYTAVILVPIGPRPQIAVEYLCNAGKKIQATLYEGKTLPPAGPGIPPTPGGSAAIVLSDGQAMTLAQTLSADGVRYANANESFVFWSKGDGAIVLENGSEKDYRDCIVVAPKTDGLTEVYHGAGFTVRLPAGYTPNARYRYQNFGPGREIAGTSFTIATSTRVGTNLADDAYVSVEMIPLTERCTANLFMDYATVSTTTDAGIMYSMGKTRDAAVGNRYDETVYVFPAMTRCVAVRYFIHYSAIENYPQGAVRAFDESKLVRTFDDIRRSLIVVQ